LNRFWGIFWIDASSEENIERGLVNIATVCGLVCDANSVKRWLSNVPETWLVIFDNADDPNLDLSRYFPVGTRGTILITTRNPDCRDYAAAGSSWELGRMEVDEAITLILKTSNVNNVSDRRMRDLAKPVVLTLGCLALAVAQAGAVIRQGVCGMGEYCELYLQRRKELLGQNVVRGGEDYRHTVYTTWEISLRAIEGMSGDTAKDAVELLQMFSFLHHDGISEEIFYRAWTGLWNGEHSDWIKGHQLRLLLRQQSTQWDPQPFRKALSILSSFSLISWDKNGLVSIHPLVHIWARDRLNRSDEEEIWMSAVSTIAVSIHWTYRTADYWFRRALVPHVDACLGFYDDGIFHLQAIGNEYLEMAEKFALVYQENGRQQDALELLERVATARKKTQGEEHPDTLASVQSLANCYSKVGRRKEALQLSEKVVAANKRTQGEEHPTTLDSIHNLAKHYSEVGRREEALQLLEKVVAANKRMLGEEHPKTLVSIHNLANCYTTVGRREEALQLLEKVVPANKRTQGEEHPDTLASMRGLASRYREVGRREEALHLLEKVVAVSKRTQGEEHPNTLVSIHNLANCYNEVGRGEEALQLLEKVVAADKRMLGEEHPKTLVSIHNLANCYNGVGRREEALQLLEMVVAVSKRTQGEEHPNTLTPMRGLASCYSEVGRREEALQLLEKVVAVSKRTQGEEHPNTLLSIHSLANRYNEVGRREEALQLLEKVVAANKRTRGEEHPNTLTSMHDLANCYSEVGRREEALKLLEKVLAAEKRTLGEEHPDTLLSQRSLTILKQAPSTPAKAPWQHLDSKKMSSNHNPDKFKGKQKKSISHFWRKFI
jgi:tetratricopeptide (TPR) repeat protein